MHVRHGEYIACSSFADILQSTRGGTLCKVTTQNFNENNGYVRGKTNTQYNCEAEGHGSMNFK